ncbi:hypothetical protein Bbelb_310540, partial [Branchiostoma belcheri]
IGPTAGRIGRRPEGDPTRGRAGTEGDAEYTANHQNRPAFSELFGCPSDLIDDLAVASDLAVVNQTMGRARLLGYSVAHPLGDYLSASATASGVRQSPCGRSNTISQ